MLSFIFLVFYAEDLLEFPNQSPGLKGYWQKTPPAAALAKSGEEAANYFDYLKETITGSEKETREIHGYGSVTGKTHKNGALLSVKGYKVFVANCTFATVLKFHLDALIKNYLTLSEKVKASTVSVTGGDTVSATKEKTGDETTAAASSKPPTPGTMTAASTVTEHDHLQQLTEDTAKTTPATSNSGAIIQQQNTTNTTPPSSLATDNKPPLVQPLTPPGLPASNSKPLPENSNNAQGGTPPQQLPSAEDKKPAPNSTADQKTAANQNLAHAAIDATAATAEKKAAAKARYDAQMHKSPESAWEEALLGFKNAKNSTYQVTKPTFL